MTSRKVRYINDPAGCKSRLYTASGLYEHRLNQYCIDLITCAFSRTTVMFRKDNPHANTHIWTRQQTPSEAFVFYYIPITSGYYFENNTSFQCPIIEQLVNRDLFLNDSL